MSRRYYSSTARATTLSASITASQTSFQVGSASGYPTLTPFTIALDKGLPTEELCTVTAVSGTSLTVIRGEDGTFPVEHSVGAGVEHVTSARDYNDMAAHAEATSGVHGVPGDLKTYIDSKVGTAGILRGTAFGTSSTTSLFIANTLSVLSRPRDTTLHIDACTWVAGFDTNPGPIEVSLKIGNAVVTGVAPGFKVGGLLWGARNSYFHHLPAGTSTTVAVLVTPLAGQPVTVTSDNRNVLQVLLS